jgi:hypothetical protein
MMHACRSRFMLMIRQPAALRPATLIISCALASGCGKHDPYERVIVSGRVSFDGQPVPAGVIRFLPTAGTRTPSNAAFINDGSYRVESRGGVPVGTFRVSIQGFRTGPTGSPAEVLREAHPPNEELGALRPNKQFLPARYNDKTELTFDVAATQNEITKDWNLAP